MTFDRAVELQKAQAVWTSEIVEVPIREGSQSFDLRNASQELQASTVIGISCNFSPVTVSGTTTTTSLVQGSNAKGLNLLAENMAKRAKLEIETEGRKMMVPLEYLNVNGKQLLYAPVYIKGFNATKSFIIFGTPLPAGTNEIVEMQFIVGDRLK